MNRLQKITLIIAAATLLGSLPAMAQAHPRTSPHETVSMQYGDGRLMIVYGRPYSKDPKGTEIRKIWGGLVPYGAVWRTGADEATLLLTEQALDVQGTTIPAGAYTLYTLPTPEGGKLIFNKQIGQWGTEYSESKDFARIDLKKTATDKPYDQFTVVLEKNDKSKDPTAGYIALRWENTEYYVEIAVKK